MLNTRLCDLLGIEHPIVSAPMAGAAGGELVAAVSEAGGFGLIGNGSASTPEWLRDQIRIVRERTDRPFGVGFISSFPGLDDLIRVALITAQGTEAGGHTGHNGTLPMVPAVIDVVGDIPVIAAGGIADGRGLAAVLMLGAEGAWIGTRFVASAESAREEWMKDHIVRASSDDTILTKAYDLTSGAAFPLDVGDRVLSNEFTREWHGRDAEVVRNRAELQQRVAAGVQARDAGVANILAGTAVGLFSSIEPAGVILRRIVEEAEAILKRRPSEVLGR